MRKLIFLCHRLPDIDHDTYAARLLKDHVPIALDHHPNLRRYVVNVVEGEMMAGPRELDSIGELTFPTLEDYRERLYDSPAGERIVQADVGRFLGGSAAYECTELVALQRAAGIRPGPVEDRAPARSPGVKLFLAIRRRDGMSHEEFVKHWRDVHAPLVFEHGPLIARYVQNLGDGGLSPGAPEYDGFAELHFASDDDFFAHVMAESGAEENPVREDTRLFVGAMAVYRLGEHVARLPAA